LPQRGPAAFGPMRTLNGSQNRRSLRLGIPWLDRWLAGGLVPGSVTEFSGPEPAVCRVAAQLMATNAKRRTLVVHLDPDQASPRLHPVVGDKLGGTAPHKALSAGLSLSPGYELVVVVGGSLSRPDRPGLFLEVQNLRFCRRQRLRADRTVTVFLTPKPWLFKPDALVRFKESKIGLDKVWLEVSCISRKGGEIEMSDP
jgi:hypothetical protein